MFGNDKSHIHFHIDGASDTPPPWAVKMLQILLSIANHVGLILENEAMVDKTVDDILQDIADEKTQIGGLTALTSSLKAQVAAALAGQSIPADVQQKINQIFDGVEQNKTDIAAAINENTPAAAVDPAASGPAPASG